MGLILKHFEIDGRKEYDAAVWAQALNDHILVEYSQPDGEPVDLANADDVLRSRVSKIPKWQRDCFLQFILPFLVLLVLFSISYLLVVLGPLKGIGSPGVEYTSASSGSGVTIEVDNAEL